MLDQLFPRVHHRYASLQVLGPGLSDFANWLFRQGYTHAVLLSQIRKTPRIEEALSEQGINTIAEMTREQLRACAPAHWRDDRRLFTTVRSLERYLDALGLLPPSDPSGHTETLLNSYEGHLRDVRGLAPATVVGHRFTASEFLQHLGYEENPSCLPTLTATDIEAFIRTNGARLSRGTLQNIVARLRSFLRFLTTRGAIIPGLDAQIDTPRLYRGEKLPRSLPWETVRSFLMSIDRTSRCGLRDYTIFLLIATYGLRVSETVSLTLDDIEWRAGRIRISQHKTRGQLILPLTDEVGACLIQYLRQGRPALACRELFLRAEAPPGVLTPGAVTDAFRRWSRRSGLDIPFHGPHCLRHSYAVNLLRKGTCLKTIGDILGHQTADSTFVYLRLAVDDLRDVALPLPKPSVLDAGREGKP